MKIALLDGFPDTSHLKWAEGFCRHSQHQIDLILGDPHNWKWQMTGGTYELIEQINSSKTQYDLLLVTDMVNLPLFRAHLRSEFQDVPVAMYFHENQITYPWSPTDRDPQLQRDYHYGWINYTSARLADRIYFNSQYHRQSFLNALPGFLSQFPKFNFQNSVTEISAKSDVLYIGMDLPKYKERELARPVFIWNHRWEYDKNPDLFFNTLIELSDSGYDFGLIVLGKGSRRAPKIFEIARDHLHYHILHWGWADSDDYNTLLEKSNVALITNNQDFFGISVVEAIASGMHPFLPKRLAYPEHVAEKIHADVFYESDEELIGLLKQRIFSREIRAKLNEGVQRYDWLNIINQYDAEMEKTLTMRHKKRSG